MKKISPRSSPLLGFFKSKSTNGNVVGNNSSNSRNSSPSTADHHDNNNNARGKSPSNNNSNNNNKSTTTTAGGDTDSVGASSHVSIITKSLSKCFDNGVSMNDAIIVNDDDEENRDG